MNDTPGTPCPLCGHPVSDEVFLKNGEWTLEPFTSVGGGGGYVCAEWGDDGEPRPRKTLTLYYHAPDAMP